MNERIEKSTKSTSTPRNPPKGKNSAKSAGVSQVKTYPGAGTPAIKTTQVSSNTTNVSERRAVSPELRARMIAEAAYYRAEKRGFGCAGQLDDWLAAEAEINARYPG